MELQITNGDDSFLKNIDWAGGQAAKSSLLELVNYLNEINWDAINIVQKADRTYIMLAVGTMNGMWAGTILGLKKL